jgi:hypothetical protein
MAKRSVGFIHRAPRKPGGTMEVVRGLIGALVQEEWAPYRAVLPLTAYLDWMKASRSALIVSAWVVGIP